MPFTRFDEHQAKNLTADLSSASGPIIEGQYIFFCKVSKAPGTGSTVHYHPNEQFMFPLSGRLNGLVGKDRRIIGPGSLAHIPPYGQHQMAATEDAPADYLYVKAKNWSVVGLALDEPVPDQARTPEEIEAQLSQGGVERERDREKSQARDSGLGQCYYDILPSLDHAASSGSMHFRLEGDYMAFELWELKTGDNCGQETSVHEIFCYLIGGRAEATEGGQAKTMETGDIMQVPQGSSWQLRPTGQGPVRLVAASSLPRLEKEVTEQVSEAGA